MGSRDRTEKRGLSRLSDRGSHEGVQRMWQVSRAWEGSQGCNSTEYDGIGPQITGLGDLSWLVVLPVTFSGIS